MIEWFTMRNGPSISSSRRLWAMADKQDHSILLGVEWFTMSEALKALSRMVEMVGRG
jgi:hypothetical protein